MKKINIYYSILDGIFKKSSDAGIGFHINKEENLLYGKYHLGIYVGRFYLNYSSKFGLNFSRGFATGVGG